MLINNKTPMSVYNLLTHCQAIMLYRLPQNGNMPAPEVFENASNLGPAVRAFSKMRCQKRSGTLEVKEIETQKG